VRKRKRGKRRFPLRGPRPLFWIGVGLLDFVWGERVWRGRGDDSASWGKVLLFVSSSGGGANRLVARQEGFPPLERNAETEGDEATKGSGEGCGAAVLPRLPW